MRKLVSRSNWLIFHNFRSSNTLRFLLPFATRRSSSSLCQPPLDCQLCITLVSYIDSMQECHEDHSGKTRHCFQKQESELPTPPDSWSPILYTDGFQYINLAYIGRASRLVGPPRRGYSKNFSVGWLIMIVVWVPSGNQMHRDLRLRSKIAISLFTQKSS